jgi:hypothetical protein
MSNQIQTILLFTFLALGFLLLWAASIAITYWDASRRKLPTGETVAWIALAALVPVIGAFAYLFSRLLGMLFSPASPGQSQPGRRFTLIKRPARLEGDTGTLLAADLLPIEEPVAMPTHPSANPAGGQVGFLTANRLNIKVLDGPQRGATYPIVSLPAQIGRVPEAAVCLEQDLGVSRHHAEIYAHGGELRLRDLDSAHGTRLNGVAIEDEMLASGDRLQVGLTTLVVQIDEGTR